MRFARLIAGFLVSFALLAQSPQVRLGDKAEPLRYAVDLTLDPDSSGFSGQVEIDIRVHEPAQTIRLNAHSLEIDGVSWRVGGRTLAGGYSVVDEHNIDFGAPAPLSTGEVRLIVTYRGEYDTYVEVTAASNFEATGTNDIGFYAQGTRLRYAYTTVATTTTFLADALGDGSDTLGDQWTITQTNNLQNLNNVCN